MCAAGDRRGTINFAGKICFGALLIFALHHILFKRGVFVLREKELCI